MNTNEKALVKSYERGEWKSVNRVKLQKKRYAGYAELTFKKDKRLNIRISSKDLEGIQKIAIEEGMPYQTLISSIIHKYIANHK